MVAIKDLVDAQLYSTEGEVVQEALRYLLRARPDLRIRLAIHRYKTQEISLAKAATLAGVSWAQMKDILLEQGLQPDLGPEAIDGALDEVRTLRQHFQTAS